MLRERVRPFISPEFRHFPIPEDAQHFRIHGIDRPSIPASRVEWIDLAGNIVGRGKCDLIESIDVDHQVELRAQGEEIIQRHQLLGLLVAAEGEVDYHKLLTELGGALIQQNLQGQVNRMGKGAPKNANHNFPGRSLNDRAWPVAQGESEI